MQGTDLALEKGLPCNIDAERFVLGAVLIDDNQFIQVASAVDVEDFSLEKHRRIFMRMSSDGMLPDRLGQVSERFQTPTAATVVCAVAGAAVAALLPIDILGDLVSIGTLLSFTIVCSGVLFLRRTRPDLERPFRVKWVWLVAPLGIVFAVALMATLPITTWIRLGVWLLIGLTIYFLYARRRSGERMERLAAVEAANPGPVA